MFSSSLKAIQKRRCRHVSQGYPLCVSRQFSLCGRSYFSCHICTARSIYTWSLTYTVAPVSQCCTSHAAAKCWYTVEEVDGSDQPCLFPWANLEAVGFLPPQLVSVFQKTEQKLSMYNIPWAHLTNADVYPCLIQITLILLIDSQTTCSPS